MGVIWCNKAQPHSSTTQLGVLLITKRQINASGPSMVSVNSTNDYELPLITGATYNWTSVYSTPTYSGSNFHMYFTAPSYSTSDIIECFVTLNGFVTYLYKYINIY